MGAQHVFEQTQLRWDQEVEYAETLRTRRKLYSAALALVTGLGVFQLNTYKPDEAEFAVHAVEARILIALLGLLALSLFLVGAYHLSTRGAMSKEEKGEMSMMLGIDLDRFPRLARRLRVPRASRTLDLTGEAEDALIAADIDTGELIRAKSMEISTRLLVASNNRVSNRIRRAGFCIGLGYVTIATIIVIHTGFAQCLTPPPPQSQTPPPAADGTAAAPTP